MATTTYYKPWKKKAEIMREPMEVLQKGSKTKHRNTNPNTVIEKDLDFNARDMKQTLLVHNQIYLEEERE